MRDPFNPFGPSGLLGLRVLESVGIPRYTLPEEVCPGVPWPEGFRDEINNWSHAFLGSDNPLKPGCILAFKDHLLMRPDDFAALVEALGPTTFN